MLMKKKMEKYDAKCKDEIQFLNVYFKYEKFIEKNEIRRTFTIEFK
jgi:hypothetical protein